jgi:hypothetical protein
MMIIIVVLAPARPLDDELRRRHAGTQHASCGDPTEIDRQGSQRGSQIVERPAQVEQCAEDHVSGRAGEAVEVKRLGQRSKGPVFAKTVVLLVREDHVIEYRDPHEHTRGDQPFRQPAVVLARQRVA